MFGRCPGVAKKLFVDVRRFLVSENAGGQVALTGGRVTARVLRDNDVVRRPTTAASSFVATLLDHLKRQGFDGAPRFVGQSDGSNLLSYMPVAWIDFDTAAPGDPLEDVAYAAWTGCIASKQTVPVRRQAEQVRVLADAHGLCVIERGVLIAQLARLAALASMSTPAARRLIRRVKKMQSFPAVSNPTTRPLRINCER